MSEQHTPGELGQRCADSISPDLFAPLVKQVTEDIYERLMNEVQDYLCDNAEWNIATRIASAESESRRLREELAEVDAALGHATWLGSRAERISALRVHSNKYHSLIYAVSSKHDGEDRHQTALRYICDRDAASNADSKSAGAA